jgi:hypothetical protein
MPGELMDVFEQLLTSGSSRSVNPETLEYIGKKASNEFLEKRASLNSAIVKLAAQHPELNNEHIHRIVEFANNATFQHLFEKDHDKNVHFDIADPGTIIRDLRDGGSPAHSGKVLHNNNDYHRLPPREEKSSSMGMGGTGTSDPQSGMADLFNRENFSGRMGQGEAVEKVASAAGLDPSWEGSANPVNDIYAEHVKLTRARDELSAAYESSDMLLKQARADFYKAAKAEVIGQNGAGIDGVATVIQKLAGNKFAEQELYPVIERLIREGVSSDLLVSQFNKTAGKLINPEHPLVLATAGMVKCASEREVAFEALSDIEKGLEKTAAFLRQAART